MPYCEVKTRNLGYLCFLILEIEETTTIKETTIAKTSSFCANSDSISLLF
jgi:hypothetical protein